MRYKHTLYFLSGLVALLALANILSLVFDPERVGTRTAAFTWLDPEFRDRIDALEIYGPGARPGIKLVRKNNAWFVSVDNAEYPARQFRIDDILGALTRRGIYPVQASSASAHERLGLTEAAASRIIVRGGAGLPLLDLLVGNWDVAGRDIYLRKAGQAEVRSGEDRFSLYTSSPLSSWYNLRLFPDSEDGALDVDIVQRLLVYPPGASPVIFTREGDHWSISGLGVSNPDKNKVDSHIRFILNIEGEDFISPEDPENAEILFNDSRIVLELGNGSTRTIRIGPPRGESNRRRATVTGAYVYVLAPWAVERIFREASFFEK